jgi:hypothetical protein
LVNIKQKQVMKKQNFKFIIQTRKFGNAKTVNVKAYSFEEAKVYILNEYKLSGINWCPNTLPAIQKDIDFSKSVNPIQLFPY